MPDISKTAYSGEIPNTPIKFFLHVTKPYRWWALVATILVAIAASGSVFMRFLIEFLVAGIEANNVGEVVFWGLMYPVIFFGISLIWRASGVTAREWLLGAPKTTTDTLADYASKHSHSYFSDRFAGSVSNKISNVSNAMEEFVPMWLWSYLEQFIPVIITGIIFLRTDLTVGLLFFGLILSSLVLNIFLLPRKKNFSLALAASQSKTTGFIVDVLTNIQAVRQYVSHRPERSNIGNHTEDVRKKGSISFLYSEYMMFANSLLFTAFAVAMFTIMLDNWSTGAVSSGRLLSFILLITYTSGSVIFLGRILSHTAKLYGRAQEGLDEIMVDHEIVDQPNAQLVSIQQGSITWQAVSFAYQAENIFTRLSVHIKPGERVGLVGPSGAGKSTFVSLLLRQQDIQSGAIMIDGQNIAAVTQDSLRQNIALVPQEPLLFHRTIKENILYGKPSATETEMIQAAKRAQAHEFIDLLPDKYETLVGERGVKLSGGQKQRVAIARAIVNQPDIIIADEPTGNLDPIATYEVVQILRKINDLGTTVIMTTHNKGVIDELGRRVLTMDEGRIIRDDEQGHYVL